MDNFEKDMKEQVSDLLTKEDQCQGTSEEKMDDENAPQKKQGDKSGQGSSSTVAEGNLTLCPVCQTKAYKTCGACKSVSYCSVEHQRLDLETHQKCCAPFMIKEAESTEKEWIATRDLPADTILLEELPALSFPVWDNFDSPYCLTCGIIMDFTENKDRKCSTCSWPICSEKCEKSSLHAENECKFFSAHNINFIISGEDDFGYQIFMIRANNLKLRNKELFENVMELQDFSECPYKNEEMDDLSQENSTYYEDILFHLDNLTEAECNKLWRVFLVNHISLPIAKGVEVRLLYLQWSRLNHSCSPNCIFSMGPSPDFKVRVRTAVPVKKGESLTIIYQPELIMLPTSIRRHLLKSGGGFICKCERCLDPTELGTFMSGIKCQKCIKSSKKRHDENSGYFLPENPLDLSTDPHFKCNGCGEMKLFSVLKSSLPPEIQRAFDMDTETIENPEDFLSEYEFGGNYLHKNHYLINILIQKTIPRLDGSEGLDKLKIKRAVRRLKNLLRIAEILCRGLSQPKAYWMLDLVWAICHLLNRYSGQLEPDEIQELVNTAQACENGVLKYLKNDSSVESQEMLETLEDNIRSIATDFSLLMNPSI